MDFDQQMIVAKLKRLENNAELKRINMVCEGLVRNWRIESGKIIARRSRSIISCRRRKNI